jgi:hypothetical protein
VRGLFVWAKSEKSERRECAVAKKPSAAKRPPGGSSSATSRISTEIVLKLLLLRLQKVPQKQQMQMLGYTKASSLSRISNKYNLAELEQNIRDAVFLDDSEDDIESDPDIDEINSQADEFAKEIMAVAKDIFEDIKTRDYPVEKRLEGLDKALNTIERARKVRFKVRGLPDDRKLRKPGEEAKAASNFEDLLRESDGDE